MKMRVVRARNAVLGKLNKANDNAETTNESMPRQERRKMICADVIACSSIILITGMLFASIT